jgi:site-specific DNA recombinase
MTRVIGYARVSTEEQARTGVSLEDQQRRIALYCELHGLELLRIETDAGFSGSNLDRPGAQRVLAALKSGEAAGLVIAKLDRWTRRLRDLLDMIDFADERRVALMSIGETLDTSTAAGRMIVKVIGAVAEMEREQIGERTRDALRHKKSRGEKIGGKTPYGFDAVVNEQGRKMLVRNESEQAVIAEIWRQHAQGLSLEQIAFVLNGCGLTTREGGQWKRQYIHRIVKRVEEDAKGGTQPR